MSKRTIEDVEASAPQTDEQITKKKKHRDKGEKKVKKSDKAAVIGETSAVNGGEKINSADEGQKLKKPEKEEKMEKKEKKKKEKKKEKSNGDSAPKKTNGVTETEESKLSKAERKAAKALKKAAKEANKATNGTSTEGPSVGPSTQATPATSSTSDVPAALSSAGYTQSTELSNLSKAIVDEYLAKHSISIQDPHSSNLRPITAFSYLPPSPLDLSTFSSPTPIQAATWPFTLSGFDCIGVAETGSGKTLAFSLPAIRHISALKANSVGKMSKLGVRVLVVSPTRELAIQIFEVIEKYAKEAGMQAVCLYGGVPKDDQRQKLKTTNVVVATPGRLNDLVNEGSADLSKVSYLVLDEADRMLDKGFEEDVKRIMSAMPAKGRQTLMFTATWPQSVRELASTFMNRPVKITIGDRDDLRANVRIKQTVEVLEQHAKELRLLALVKQYQSGANKNDRILVFCLYKKEAARIENFLRSKGFRVAGIHGDLSQQQRIQALGHFKDGSCPLLVATDVAARGLDIPAVKLVINVTFPLTVEDYVHRIGRTGRAGADGIAYTFFTEHDKALSGGLVNVLKAAGQPVPENLLKFGTTVKKKEHSVYGAFYKETDGTKAATKITFDD